VEPLNVSQFLTAYNASLADVLELKASTVTGILEPKNNTIYRGEVYWFLVDGGSRVTVRIPERYRDLSGRRVEVTGQPYRQTNEDRGEIEVILRVQKITPLDPTPEDWLGPLLPIGEKRRLSWPAIERSLESRILAGDQPRVLMFFGTSSIVDKDVLAALGQHVRAYQIVEQRIPLTDPAAVAAAVQKIDADLVAIVRGGGEGISALSDRQVIDAVAHHVHVPIVSAVGHEVDRPLIQDFVHRAFPTPTALGTWLAARVTDAIQARNTVPSDHSREREAMHRQLKELTEEAGVLRRRVRRMSFVFVALGILACILVAL
jgi:exodeoxyribonuclease VII large subunit